MRKMPFIRFFRFILAFNHKIYLFCSCAGCCFLVHVGNFMNVTLKVYTDMRLDAGLMNITSQIIILAMDMITEYRYETWITYADM